MPKLDPNQTFVVLAFSRKEIASHLNEACENPDEFTPDDERLTDALCAKYVETYAYAHLQDGTIVLEDIYELAENFVSEQIDRTLTENWMDNAEEFGHDEEED